MQGQLGYHTVHTRYFVINDSRFELSRDTHESIGALTSCMQDE